MTRPRGIVGEVRQALQQAAVELYQLQGAVTHRAICERAQVGYEVGRLTVKNMANAGELRRVGKEKQAGSSRWVTLFEPVLDDEDDDSPQPWGGIEALASVVAEWPRS